MESTTPDAGESTTLEMSRETDEPMVALGGDLRFSLNSMMVPLIASSTKMEMTTIIKTACHVSSLFTLSLWHCAEMLKPEKGKEEKNQNVRNHGCKELSRGSQH